MAEKQNNIDLSLVIACYNEMHVINESVSKIKTTLDNTKFNYEIIFVDDRSTDGTVDYLKALVGKNSNMRLLCHQTNKGRGQTVTDGIKLAQGEIVGFNDIDLSTSAAYIPYLALRVKQGKDVVSARRIYKVMPAIVHRWILSRGYNILMRFLLKIDLSDTETGCKFFNRKKILPILEKIANPGWFWDTEIMVHSYLSGLKIEEVPTLFLRNPDNKSTVKIFKDSFEYFLNLVKFKHTLRKIKNNTYR